MWDLDQEEVVKNDLLPINLLKKSVIEVEESEDVEEEEGSAQQNFHLPTSSPSKSSSLLLSSTPKKMRILREIYERCNFYVLELENLKKP